MDAKIAEKSEIEKITPLRKNERPGEDVHQVFPTIMHRLILCFLEFY